MAIRIAARVTVGALTTLDATFGFIVAARVRVSGAESTARTGILGP